MPRPQVFSIDTKLWHPSEGWRLFPAGETDPGGSWHEKEGGNPVGNSAAEGALKDLIEANDRIEQMGQQLASKDHDLAQMAAAKEAAEAKVAGLEQRAIAAEAAKADAEAAAAEYMRERDAARLQLSNANAGQKPAAAKA